MEARLFVPTCEGAHFAAEAASGGAHQVSWVIEVESDGMTVRVGRGAETKTVAAVIRALKAGRRVRSGCWRRRSQLTSAKKPRDLAATAPPARASSVVLSLQLSARRELRIARAACSKANSLLSSRPRPQPVLPPRPRAKAHRSGGGNEVLIRFYPVSRTRRRQRAEEAEKLRAQRVQSPDFSA